MKLSPKVLMFVAIAALSWGVYVPIVHEAAAKLGSNLRAFLFVGVAYFLVAVLVPLVFIFNGSDPTVKMNADGTSKANFSATHVMWGIAAGVSGAVGALCVIFAVTQAGKGGALYVAPLVFAGAPIINTLATIYFFHPTGNKPDWKFFLGLGMAAAGAVMVMLFKPKPTPASAEPPAIVQPAETA